MTKEKLHDETSDWFSEFHREALDNKHKVMDVDWIEFFPHTHRPYMVYEECASNRRPLEDWRNFEADKRFKRGVIYNIGEGMNIPAYILFHSLMNDGVEFMALQMGGGNQGEQTWIEGEEEFYDWVDGHREKALDDPEIGSID